MRLAAPWGSPHLRGIALLGLFREVRAGVLTWLLVVSLTLSGLPVISAVLSRLLLSQARAHEDGSAIAWGGGAVVAALCVVLFVQQIASLVLDPLREHAARLIDGRFRRGVAKLALAPDEVAHLDDGWMAGRFVTASTDLQGTYTPGRASVTFLTVLCQSLGGLACATLIAATSPWLAVTSVAAFILRNRLQISISLTVNALWVRTAHLSTRHHYWSRFVASAHNAMEVRVFGLGPWIAGRYVSARLAQEEPLERARSRALPANAVPFVIGAAAMFFGLAGIVQLSRVGDPGVVAQDVSALLAVSALGGTAFVQGDIEYGWPAVEAAAQLRARLVVRPTPDAADKAARQGRDDASATAPTIRFEDVSFSYPNGGRPVLDALNLEVRPGEVLAIVGMNGAGKSTSLKLLARGYRPQRGQITADGVDIATIPADEWRRSLALVTQGFMRLDLSVRQNIEIGAPERIGDHAFFESVEAELGVSDLVAGLPHSWGTPLSRTRTGGRELSGGQWQRIALARAIFALRAGRSILMLDEPTAHLDAETELHTFRRLISLARGASVILISHRLSTVRLADRIAVLRDGGVSEIGSHDRLIANGLDYNELFNLQAQQFTGTPGTAAGE